jgi:hypothetical protein
MNKNRIQGAANQGERANNREALVTKGKRRRSGGKRCCRVLQPVLDPTFSEHSYGFRPGRSAHDAVLAAQSYVQSGRRIVVDVDLEKFFDRVSHGILIGRLQKRIGDAGVIRLIRAYLNSGVMADGVVQERIRGTPHSAQVAPCGSAPL